MFNKWEFLFIFCSVFTFLIYSLSYVQTNIILNFIFLVTELYEMGFQTCFYYTSNACQVTF